MEYSMTRDTNGIQVMLSGNFTFAFNQKFKEILALLDKETAPTIVLNLKDVDFIDSAGLGMLLLLRDQCNQRNVHVELTQAQGQVEKIFLLSRFDQLFGSSHTEH